MPGEPRNMAEAFAGMKADYQAAKDNRFRRKRTGYSLSGSGADYHYAREIDFIKMIEVARDMDRNDAVVGAAIDRAVSNTIQNGFTLNPDTGDAELDRELMQRFADWAEDPAECDLAGEMSFRDFERLSFRQHLIDGDAWLLSLGDGHLEFKEAHRVRTPFGQRAVHGVQLSDKRERVAYWFTREDTDSYSMPRVGKFDLVPAVDKEGHPQVFQVYSPKRVTQTRGVSALVPLFDVLTMFEDLNFAKLVQAQLVSCIAFLSVLEGGAPPLGTNPTQLGKQTEVETEGGFRKVLENISPGMIIRGKAGEKLTGFSPQVPNAEFFDHVRLLLQLVGINIGLPLVVMLLDASQTNFSGWRGAVDQARMGFRDNQQNLIRRLHRPVYLSRLRRWVTRERQEHQQLAAKAETLGERFYRHHWDTPSWPYIEPTKDAQGDVLRLESNLISPRRLHAERGRDWDEIQREIVEDNVKLITAAATAAEDLNKQFPDAKVDWRELCNKTVKDKPAKEGGGQGDEGEAKNGD